MQLLINSVLVLCVIGFFFSAYARNVEKKLKFDSRYKPLCDLSNKIKCSSVLSSRYGKHFGLPNSVYGMLFYMLIFVLTYFEFENHLKIVFYLSLLALLGTFYLIYVLYFKLKNFCLVCNGIYLVNILLFVFSYILVS